MPLCDTSNPDFFFREKIVAQTGGGQVNQGELRVPNTAAPLRVPGGTVAWTQSVGLQVAGLDSRFPWLQLGL